MCTELFPRDLEQPGCEAVHLTSIHAEVSMH